MARTKRYGSGGTAGHPSFSVVADGLVCPFCSQVFPGPVREYDRHFLGHDPTREQARRWLSGKGFDWVALSRGWLIPCPGSGTPVVPSEATLKGRGTFLECPACGRLCRYRAGLRVAPHAGVGRPP